LVKKISLTVFTFPRKRVYLKTNNNLECVYILIPTDPALTPQSPVARVHKLLQSLRCSNILIYQHDNDCWKLHTHNFDVRPRGKKDIIILLNVMLNYDIKTQYYCSNVQLYNQLINIIYTYIYLQRVRF